MVPNAQKHLEVAELYEQLSADDNASIEWRIAYARKAKWHRILARTSAEKDHPVAKEKPRQAGVFVVLNNLMSYYCRTIP